MSVTKAITWITRSITSMPRLRGQEIVLTRRPLYIKFGFTGQMYLNCTCDDSNYNALQITGVKRFTKNYSFHSAFTYAKALDDEIGARGPQGGNPYDLKGSYGVSYLNQAVVWTTTHSILIPLAKGSVLGRMQTQLLRTCSVAGLSMESPASSPGLALAPTDSDSSTLNADFSQRPDRMPNVPLSPRGKDRHLWLNPAAFVTPPVCCVWGNASPGIMRGPAYYDLDWAYGKDLRF